MQIEGKSGTFFFFNTLEFGSDMAFKKKAYWFLSDMDGSNILVPGVRHHEREARLGTCRASKLGYGHKDSPMASWLSKMMMSLGAKDSYSCKIFHFSGSRWQI